MGFTVELDCGDMLFSTHPYSNADMNKAPGRDNCLCDIALDLLLVNAH